MLFRANEISFGFIYLEIFQSTSQNFSAMLENIGVILKLYILSIQQLVFVKLNHVRMNQRQMSSGNFYF